MFAVLIPNGPPMPSRSSASRVPHFPLTLSLGDGDAMMEGNKLAAHAELQFRRASPAAARRMNKEGAFGGLRHRADQYHSHSAD